MIRKAVNWLWQSVNTGQYLQLHNANLILQLYNEDQRENVFKNQKGSSKNKKSYTYSTWEEFYFLKLLLWRKQLYCVTHSRILLLVWSQYIWLTCAGFGGVQRDGAPDDS